MKNDPYKENLIHLVITAIIGGVIQQTIVGFYPTSTVLLPIASAIVGLIIGHYCTRYIENRFGLSEINRTETSILSYIIFLIALSVILNYSCEAYPTFKSWLIPYFASCLALAYTFWHIKGRITFLICFIAMSALFHFQGRFSFTNVFVTSALLNLVVFSLVDTD